eukprot:CAMPEP_0185280416 /NCGR_PEP_ID=MMETSP1359-20130426/66033_1 /TAXON_ID=552665 /ORGANISM="Bigelowiella longifila, Strain CCMP242" /LENGTH=76 /DNA_ID=CAMNT_0027875655 /DNA_START=202 /DNA_END=429 /DNA_ORIENTATION=-
MIISSTASACATGSRAVAETRSRLKDSTHMPLIPGPNIKPAMSRTYWKPNRFTMRRGACIFPSARNLGRVHGVAAL